ncbi:serine/threonine-protein phosphatase 1 regulatory subunit 10 isoform X3 [Atheta coriaria]
MTKFSKKLVSKCIYVLILKNTERQLLGSFMGEGGWNLIHSWLQDAHVNKNWALVAEVLELLLLTPVDVERLKMNNLPKLVKGLSKREDLQGIQQLASNLVEQWLTIVKDVTKQEAASHQHQQQLQQQVVIPADQLIMAGDDQLTLDSTVTMLLESSNDPEPMEIDETISNDANTIVSENGVDTSLRIKFVRDGKKVISRIVAVRTDSNATDDANTEAAAIPPSATADDVDAVAAVVKTEDSEGTDKENSDKKQSVPKKSSSSSSSSKTSSSSSSRDRDKDKDRDRSRDKSKSRSSSSSSSSKSSSRDKDRRDRDKDRHKHNGSSSSSSSSKHRSSSSSKSSSSSSSKDKKDPKDKEKQAEKDKDTLAKIQPQTLAKIGRIPKKTEDSKKEPRKTSFSVEVRDANEEKPKTVKVYNSKMRSTGLLEEAKPPPPRSATKKTAAPPTLPATIPTKRSSPIRDTIPPPEKRSRLIDADKGIKLIPPKPKPAVLQESDIFMDALTASATAKKEPKKRKRRTSTSKDSSPPPSPSKQCTPASPTGLKNITPANFYQDTLVTDNDSETKEKSEDGGDAKEKTDDKDEDKDSLGAQPAEPDDNTMEETTKTDANGLKGVLSYGKRKGPKRSIRWRPDADLVEVQYFELDETERVNVMKPFMDMQRMEMAGEREAHRQRKLPSEDIMDTQMQWRNLIEVECLPPPAEFGSKSLEKSIQFAREKTVLQAIYFNRVPDTPAEPDHEVHTMVTAIVIPLHDPDQPEQDAPIQPWPEAKGSPPHISNTPGLFNNVQPPPFLQAPNAFPPNGLPQFAPAFVPPGMLNRPPTDWNILSNGIPTKFPPPDLMQQVPPLFDNFGANGPGGGGMGPGVPPDGFVPPFQNGPNPMPQMFPPNNFNNNNMRGRGGFRRGGPNNGPWLRMGAPNQGGAGGGWNNQGRGRGFCNSFKQKGYCRNRDNCPYIH